MCTAEETESRAGNRTVQAKRANAASAAVLTAEMIGSFLMWLPGLAWLWIGGRVYVATNSLAADMAVAFLGFSVTTVLAMMALQRIDRVWVTLRCQAGHDQAEGALAQVMVISIAVGGLLFMIWFYFLEQAYLIPFMPSE